MRAMRNQTLAWLLSASLLAGVFLPTGIGWAEKKAPESAAPESQASVQLGDIRSFGVYELPTDFSTRRDQVPQELVEYARTALQNDSRMQYSFQADGLLRFLCDNDSCSRIRAEVTYGDSGPVVWQTIQQYRRCPFVEFRFMPDSRKFTDKIMKQLAVDYEKSVKAVPMKIQIREE